MAVSSMYQKPYHKIKTLIIKLLTNSKLPVRPKMDRCLFACGQEARLRLIGT